MVTTLLLSPKMLSNSASYYVLTFSAPSYFYIYWNIENDSVWAKNVYTIKLTYKENIQTTTTKGSTPDIKEYLLQLWNNQTTAPSVTRNILVYCFLFCIYLDNTCFFDHVISILISNIYSNCNSVYIWFFYSSSHSCSIILISLSNFFCISYLLCLPQVALQAFY